MALTYTWDLTSSFVYLFYITKDYIYKRLQEDKKKANFNKALKRETNHFASQNGFCILQKREKKKKVAGFFLHSSSKMLYASQMRTRTQWHLAGTGQWWCLSYRCPHWVGGQLLSPALLCQTGLPRRYGARDGHRLVPAPTGFLGWSRCHTRRIHCRGHNSSHCPPPHNRLN